MNFALRPGVTFALVGQRALFLDIMRDRYFALSPASEEAFLRVVRGNDLSAQDHKALARLATDRLLVPASTETLIAPCARPVIRTSLVDAVRRREARGRDVVAALASLVSTTCILKAGSLNSLVSRTEQRIRGLARDADRHNETTLDIASGFIRAGRLASSLDQCLPRSFAAARVMLARNVRPTIVFGVKLGPFAAHCWVQHQDRLLIDRHDDVRPFTPIRILT